MEHLRRLHLGVLGVPTAAYFPFCFFNLLSPVLDVLFGFIGFKVPTTAPAEDATTKPQPDARLAPGEL